MGTNKRPKKKERRTDLTKFLFFFLYPDLFFTVNGGHEKSTNRMKEKKNNNFTSGALPKWRQ
jgi:hypothetical protein